VAPLISCPFAPALLAAIPVILRDGSCPCLEPSVWDMHVLNCTNPALYVYIRLLYRKLCSRDRFPYVSCDTQMAVSQFPLLGLCHSIISVVTSVILLLATLLLTLFSSVTVCKAISLSSCQRAVALTNKFVQRPAVMRCCQPEVYSQQAAFHV